VELEMGNEKFTAQVVVVSPLTSEAILGLDFLKEHEALIDLTSRNLHLKGRGCHIPLADPTPRCGGTIEQSVHAVRTVEVPPRSMLEIAADFKVSVEGVWLLEEAVDKSLPFAVARALVKPTSTTVPVCILNPTEEPVTVYAGMLLATLQSVTSPTGDVADTSGRTATSVAAVTAEKQEVLLNLVEESGADLSADLGRTDKLQHRINTGDAHPIRQSVCRVPLHRQEEVRKLLNQMLEKGVIEPSTSPWASLIVLVQKKDGSTRFCVDYRKVNDVTLKDAYPLPRIDTTLDALHGSQWFTTLDLLTGYW
jgi:hypothetical protein